MIKIQKNNLLMKGLAGLGICSAFLGNTTAQNQSAKTGKKMNVLFIAVDDMRPLLGCYGDPVVKSPNIDRIAKNGMVFTRAYCQQAVSNPTRASLLTGLRPDETRVFDNAIHFRKNIPEVITLPQNFKNNGYYCLSFGKIFHFIDSLSWSEPSWHPNRPPFLTPEGQELVRKNGRKEFTGIPYEAPDVEDNALKDGQTADKVIEALQRIKDRTFFLAAGFLKPHLPLVAPKKYWDLYDPKQFKLADNPFLPDGTPKYSIGEYEEIRSYLLQSPGWPITDEEAIKLIHGYNACISYTDAQIGRVIDELERLKLLENTVIILWGDHGWHLGEHGHWAKATNFEVATRSPLIISVPGQPKKGLSTNALVEFVDIYPSLCDICDIPVGDGLAGVSFKPLLQKPGLKWKEAAFSQFPRAIPGYGNGMGHSIRTDRYRLTEWTVPGTSFCEYELYDHNNDPKENRNLAKSSEYSDLVKQLSAQLHAGSKKTKSKN
jgi:iduronate 2-sulfatase